MFLPELEIQAGFRNLSGFFNKVGSISRDSTFNFDFASICTRDYPKIGKPMDFSPEAEDEVIREAASHKLDRPLVNP